MVVTATTMVVMMAVKGGNDEQMPQIGMYTKAARGKFKNENENEDVD